MRSLRSNVKIEARKANAARQAAYRARHLQDVNGDGERINAVVSVAAKAQLGRLARHYGVTKRAVLDRLLRDAEGAALDGVEPAMQRAYYRD